ncbi:MAG: protein kinase [Paracoccaceae bacterium]|nr:protein kinase [Paracoccaceae bacterium]
MESQYENAHSRFADEILQITSESQTPRGAFKKLLPIEEGEAEHEAAAFERMRLELSTLQSAKQPALVKVLDSNFDKKWFVMEFLERGTLSSRLDKYKGNVLDALRNIRPIVDAISVLHTSNVVHSDIKPDNIFIASDDRLVLGDCGLAFKLENENRLTVTFKNVCSGTFGHRGATQCTGPICGRYSTPSACLYKVLSAIVSGRPRFPFWHSYRPENNLREMFRDEPAV